MKRISMVMVTGLLAMFGMFATAGAASALPYAAAPTLSIVGCSDVKSGIAVQIAGLLKGSTVTISGPSGTMGEKVRGNGTAAAKLPVASAATTRSPRTGVDADSTAWTGTATVTVVESCAVVGGVEDVPMTRRVGTSDAVVAGVSDDDSDGTTEAASETAAGGLADTGSEVGLLGALGVGALVIGAAAVVVGRTRRRSSTDEA